MDAKSLEELCALKKSQNVRLITATDVTRRISEALDRRDEVSIQMLLGEREEPLQELSELKERLLSYVNGLPEADAIRADALLRGAAAQTEAENALVEQVTQYRRSLSALIDLDREQSLRLGGKNSFYKKFRNT